MKYLEFDFNCNPSQGWQQDLLIDRLGDTGFDTFEQTEEGFKAYIPEPNFNPIDLETVLLNLDSDFQVSYKLSSIAPQNWNTLWESNFQPIFIKDQVYVRATFHDVRPDYPIEILIDPKMAFGTGHHQTTSLMMEYILEESLEGKSILDIGCGTGILGILASKLLAKNIVSIDNDSICVESSKENKQLNNISNMKVLEGSVSAIPNQHFDVILANINRNILLEHLYYYSQAMVPGGNLFLSGFYQGEDLDLLEKEASKYGFEFLGYKTRDNWVAAKFIFNKEN
ncbi:50S ribosomal protein L11 methyltransferase [Albibacterium sp.]|uniref:50S ribosomal protein L11 methyltransferase n=1 Tax=Albibacterium sp. TaxID=2952885 RepID=UPI002C6A46AE|nr:50S ribosomal protein L11 methyltransferase [Albibacterium sp.]HUH18630.1 50S ribosomal protein L11 methyltransferase [Albibacterium sp.]